MNRSIALCGVLVVLPGLLLVHGCPGSFGPAGPGGLSDVPCFTPAEWSEDTVSFASRQDVEGSDVLLFTAQIRDQALSDVDDGTRDFIPHEAVYRFDPVSGDFTLVDDTPWDTAEGEICTTCGDAVDEGPFVIEEGKLLFNGTEVPVAGRRARNIFDPAISGCVELNASNLDAIAVLSIDGNVGFLGGTTGQHYHQLFSKVDGSQIGPTQRLGMGGGSVFGCWTADEKYVVYSQNTASNPLAGRICVVPVAEELADHGSR